MKRRRSRVYTAIVRAVENERIIEPFTNEDFRENCLGFGNGTYNAFLHKHRKGNPAGSSELFILVSPCRFKLIRPVKYEKLF